MPHNVDIGFFTEPLSLMGPSLLNAQFLHLSFQGAGMEPEELGRTVGSFDLTPGHAKHMLDVPAHGIVKTGVI
jgi:hypothetical protein